MANVRRDLCKRAGLARVRGRMRGVGEFGPAMQVTLIGILALAVAALGFRFGQRFMLTAVALFVPLEAAAAINLISAGGVSVLCAHLVLAILVAQAALAAFVRHGALTMAAPPISGWLLAALIVYGWFSALVYPRLFAGDIDVYTLARVVDASGVVRIPLVPLGPTSSNFTQPLYLTASLILFLLVYGQAARDIRFGYRVAGVVAGVHLTFAALDFLSAYAPTGEALALIRTASYSIADEQAFDGVRRVIGASTEPSSFGTASIVMFAFYVGLFLSRRRFVDLGLAGAFLACILASLSSTGIAALAVVASLAALTTAARFVAQGLRPRLLVGALALVLGAAAAVAVTMGTPVERFWTGIFETLFLDKFDSSSGLERSNWFNQGLANFSQTFGLGVGLGSSRASGLAAGVLGQMGLPGAVLFVAFMLTTFLRFLRPSPQGAPEEAAALFRGARGAAVGGLTAALLSGGRVDLGLLWFMFAAIAAAAFPLARAERRSAVERLAEPRPDWPEPIPLRAPGQT